MPSSAPGRETCSPPAKRHCSRSPISTLSRGFPSMSASCSRRFRIRCACSAALVWGAAVLCPPLAAQQLDEAQIGELARLLAAADARNFDAALVGTGLRDADERVRRQAADRKSTRLNSSHVSISYAVFCLKKKKIQYGVFICVNVNKFLF